MSFTIKGTDSPCRTCSRKGCGNYHDECEDYAIFKAGCKKRNEAEHMRKHENGQYLEHKRRRKNG